MDYKKVLKRSVVKTIRGIITNSIISHPPPIKVAIVFIIPLFFSSPIANFKKDFFLFLEVKESLSPQPIFVSCLKLIKLLKKCQIKISLRLFFFCIPNQGKVA